MASVIHVLKTFILITIHTGAPSIVGLGSTIRYIKNKFVQFDSRNFLLPPMLGSGKGTIEFIQACWVFLIGIIFYQHVTLVGHDS